MGDNGIRHVSDLIPGRQHLTGPFEVFGSRKCLIEAVLLPDAPAQAGVCVGKPGSGIQLAAGWEPALIVTRLRGTGPRAGAITPKSGSNFSARQRSSQGLKIFLTYGRGVRAQIEQQVTRSAFGPEVKSSAEAETTGG